MGASIHVFTEYYHFVYDKWVNVDNWRVNPYYKNGENLQYYHNEIYLGNDYDLFELLAGVRGDESLMITEELRGLPEDVTDIVLEQYNFYKDNYLYHSENWLLLSELIKHKKKTKTNVLDQIINPLTERLCQEEGIRKIKDIKSRDISKNIRIVFWFDN